ncbi:hypothetical protein CASFOL_020852 [Castilleja foliolosa]|uniref:Late embryogenesis abundant protein LEA-2 subgroup domain-containing protein n=1 Tax=Castilleja foliolosa TaxID=1961234 RepID=A0ABD3D216_9LAMI
MNENVSSRGHDTSSYNRLSTLELEGPNNPHPEPEPEPESTLQYCFDIHHQLESACHVIDWDRVFMATFATISLILILTASFFPILKSGLVTDSPFQHRFILDSLTISEFQATPSQVTGKCDVIINITNIGEKSLYHENAVMSVFLDHELLWVERTGGFFLESMDRTVFNVSMNTTSVSVPASFVPTALLESRKFKKPLRFKLKYDGMVREGLDAWHEDRSHVYVVCGWILMEFVSETVIAGGPASCTIENF